MIHLHVVRMQSVRKEMALELVIVFKGLRVILTVIEVVDANVKEVKIVLITLLAYETNVSILALAHVEQAQFVSHKIMFLDALVLLDLVEMLCSTVEKSQELHLLKLTLAYHHLVDLHLSVEKLTTKQSAHVYHHTLALHPIVDQSVLPIQNVHSKCHALITDVKIHVLILVVLKQTVELIIIIPSALVLSGIRVIRLQDVQEYVS